ncbi:MAG TPA: hypothetical protein VK797_14375 [Tepidisphaeraceae bacterium]|jgi:hypothetical protein|nr:hypothetical protein [Tepidisphaeraceae bacterium]
MNLMYAVERLLETGWCPSGESLERLPDGRAYPSILAVQREFTRAGLELSIKQNLVFGCCRATWAPAGEAASEEKTDARHGTVVGSCEREAAVYALAQLREARQEQQLQLQVATATADAWDMEPTPA